MYGNRGPINTILIGSNTVATVFFHGVGDPVPKKESPYAGKTRASVPNNAFDANRKANPATIKRITNVVLDISIMHFTTFPTLN